MTPPDEPPSNPYDPNWPKPEQPHGQPPAAQPPYGQPPADSTDPAPYAPYGQTQPYGQTPYGQTPYGAPSYGTATAPQHPSATTAMVLGLISLIGMFTCFLPVFLAPFAWAIGGRAVREIDANPGRFSGREQAQAGRIMGMIGTGLLVLAAVALVAFIALAIASVDSSDTSYDQDSGYDTSDSAF